MGTWGSYIRDDGRRGETDISYLSCMWCTSGLYIEVHAVSRLVGSRGSHIRDDGRRGETDITYLTCMWCTSGIYIEVQSTGGVSGFLYTR